MGSDISTVLNFEGHNLTFLDHDGLGRLLKATDLAEPMGRQDKETGEWKPLTQQAISYKVGQLHPEDRVQVELVTFGGRQKVEFLTPSGALQVMATGRSKKCARLRKVVCDFFVKHGGESPAYGFSERIHSLEAEVSRLRSLVEIKTSPARALSAAVREDKFQQNVRLLFTMIHGGAATHRAVRSRRAFRKRKDFDLHIDPLVSSGMVEVRHVRGRERFYALTALGSEGV